MIMTYKNKKLSAIIVVVLYEIQKQQQWTATSISPEEVGGAEGNRVSNILFQNEADITSNRDITPTVQ